jgi:hypothetical protein
MYPTMLLMLLFVALVASIHASAAPTRTVYILLALCSAIVAAAVLLIDYFVEVTVMQPSLEKGHLEEWTILTQYNPNGVFIALDELGYLLMSLAFVCLVPAFAPKNRLERAIRWLLTLSFAATVVALIGVSASRGNDRGDLFEILVISIVWMTLIVVGRFSPSCSGAPLRGSLPDGRRGGRAGGEAAPGAHPGGARSRAGRPARAGGIVPMTAPPRE